MNVTFFYNTLYPFFKLRNQEKGKKVTLRKGRRKEKSFVANFPGIKRVS